MQSLSRSENFSFDPLRQAVQREGQVVSLTPKAAAILSCLIEHAGSLVTHDELLDKVWPDTFIQPEAIKVYIFELRRALGDSARNSTFIETVPNRGYCLKIPPTALESRSDAESRNFQLFGREQEMEVLASCHAKSLRGASQTVCLSGDAGIGKTALVDAFLSDVQRLGMPVIKGQCVRLHGEQEPYYPVLEALGKVRLDGFADALVRYAPTWAIQLPLLVSLDQRSRLSGNTFGAAAGLMLREICELLEHLSRSVPLLFVLEDVHWADDATIGLLSALAQRQSQARLLTMFTFRSIDLLQPSHPLKRVSRDLMGKACWTPVELTPLGPGAVEKIIEQELGAAACTSDLVHRVHESSGGNPLFIGSILRRMRNSTGESAGLEGAVWNSPGLALSDDLQSLLLAQFRALPGPERLLLEFAAVVGPAFSPADVAALAGWPVVEAEASLERLVEMTEWIRQSPDSFEFEFKHALYRDVIYRHTGRRRRSAAHLCLAEDLERLQGPVEDHAAELAWRYHECDQPEKAVHYLLVAARSALDRSAPGFAVTLLAKALALVLKFPDGERRIKARIEVLLLLLKAQSLLGTFTYPCDAREELLTVALLPAVGIWPPGRSISPSRPARANQASVSSRPIERWPSPPNRSCPHRGWRPS